MQLRRIFVGEFTPVAAALAVSFAVAHATLTKTSFLDSSGFQAPITWT